MSQKTVKEIVVDYLRKNGYDGLCGDSCGCGIDDLFPCDYLVADCTTAYQHCCKKCPDAVNCEIYDDVLDGVCYRPEKQL